jgi:heat-inducible transcriptional repressor
VERVLRTLNQNLAGKGLEDIDALAIRKHARFGAAGAELLQAALESTREYLGAIEDMVFIGGTANIVREMDTSGKEWAQTLLDALERQYFIIELLKDIIQENKLTVRIGEENRLTELQRCSLVGTSYALGQGTMGSLGVVGPTSIDYAHTIGMVRYMAENLARILQGPAE